MQLQVGSFVKLVGENHDTTENTERGVSSK